MATSNVSIEFECEVLLARISTALVDCAPGNMLKPPAKGASIFTLVKYFMWTQEAGRLPTQEELKQIIVHSCPVRGRPRRGASPKRPDMPPATATPPPSNTAFVPLFEKNLVKLNDPNFPVKPHTIQP